ncbi:hypothetical protein [Mycolicibacterium pulveris]|uniref:hypothetical protein n=1 Tax=Mycolicibacterium pulveris TaxID=36813 RepID=UPI003CF35B03
MTTAALLTVASFGLAGPAAAESLDGAYTGTVTGGPGPVGERSTWVFTSCGPGCVQETSSNRGMLQLQGNTWTGMSDGCTLTIDNGSLVGAIACPGYAPLQFQLTKAG